MPDELIEELWQIKDGIAREHGYDVDALVAHLPDPGKDGKPAGGGSARCKGGRRTRCLGEASGLGSRSRDTGEPVATAPARQGSRPPGARGWLSAAQSRATA